MGWLKSILGGAYHGDASPSAKQAGVSSLAEDYIGKDGGIENVLQKFQRAGLTNKVRSWVSTGPNLPINTVELQQALGREKLAELARDMDIPVDKVKELLAERLPIAVDRLTPEGKLAPREKA
jgi:uncharacterized protein YidB (DUF937 family)